MSYADSKSASHVPLNVMVRLFSSMTLELESISSVEDEEDDPLILLVDTADVAAFEMARHSSI